MKIFSLLMACLFFSAIDASDNFVSAEQEIKKQSAYSRYILASHIPAYLRRSKNLALCASGGIGEANYLVGAVHKAEKLGLSWQHDKENCATGKARWTMAAIGYICAPIASLIISAFKEGANSGLPLLSLCVGMYVILPLAIDRISYYQHVQDVRLCNADELSVEAQEILRKKLGTDYGQQYDLFMSAGPLVCSLDTSSSELHIIKD